MKYATTAIAFAFALTTTPALAGNMSQVSAAGATNGGYWCEAGTFIGSPTRTEVWSLDPALSPAAVADLQALSDSGDLTLKVTEQAGITTSGTATGIIDSTGELWEGSVLLGTRSRSSSHTGGNITIDGSWTVLVPAGADVELLELHYQTDRSCSCDTYTSADQCVGDSSVQVVPGPNLQ